MRSPARSRRAETSGYPEAFRRFPTGGVAIPPAGRYRRADTLGDPEAMPRVARDVSGEPDGLLSEPTVTASEQSVTASETTITASEPTAASSKPTITSAIRDATGHVTGSGAVGHATVAQETGNASGVSDPFRLRPSRVESIADQRAQFGAGILVCSYTIGLVQARTVCRSAMMELSVRDISGSADAMRHLAPWITRRTPTRRRRTLNASGRSYTMVIAHVQAAECIARLSLPPLHPARACLKY